MGEIDIVATLIDAGTSIIFLWLYYMERQRSKQLSDERVSLVRDCMDRLQKCYDEEEDPPTPFKNLTTKK